MTNKRGSLRFRDWRILTKLLVVMLVLSWIPLSAATTFAVSSRASAAKIEMENYILHLTSEKTEELQESTTAFVIAYQNKMRTVADDPDIITFLDNSNTGRASLRDGAMEKIAALIATDPAIGYGALIDAGGTVAVSTSPSEPGTDHLYWPHVQAALDGEAATSEIQIGRRDGSPGFFLATPVRRDAAVIGAVVTRVQADFMLTAVTGTVEGPNSPEEMRRDVANIFLVNGEATVVAHSDPDSAWLYRGLGSVTSEEPASAAAESIAANPETGQSSLAPADRPAGEPPRGEERSKEAVSATDGSSGPEAPADEQVPDSQAEEQTNGIPAAQPLAEAILAAFASSDGGTIRYCHPDTVDAALDASCSDGSWYRASYEPVRDPLQGDTLTIVVFDVPEAPFMAPVRAQTVLSVGGAVIFASVLIGVSIVVARTLARPILKLAAVAQTVEEDEPFVPETIADVTAQGDEVGRLARVFSDMVVAVQARERKLKQEVQELRIQIDQAKRQRQVNEIVEDDFFKDLKAKAKEMRGQRRGSSSTEAET